MISPRRPVALPAAGLLAAAFLALVAVPAPALAQQPGDPSTAGDRSAEQGVTPDERALQQEIAALQRRLVDLRGANLTEVTVNGKRLPPAQVRREAVFVAGARLVEAKIAEFFIDEWKQAAIEEMGRKPEEFEISEAELTAGIKTTVEEFMVQNPGIEFWGAVRAVTGLDREGFIAQRRQTELFNRVFFPGPPTEWPAITKEAIMASAAEGQGREFMDNIEKSAVDPDTGEARELPPFWMQLCTQWVQKQLKVWSEIRYPADGLPPDVVLSVNGRTWGTDEAFEMIRPGLYVQDLEQAMTEVVIREALRQELIAAGAYLDDEEFRNAFAEYRKEYDGTPFNTEVIATAFKGYPSLEAYRQRWRLIQSFENMIAKEINDDNLGAHAEKHARFFADGQTSVDVIQFLGRDVQTSAWVPEGMAMARERAQQAFEAIEGGAGFDEVLDTRGEYYGNDQDKGRLGLKPLNQIRQALRENEFTDLLMGYSLGYHVFFDAPEGSVVGPLRGSDAYYLARVNTRTPATSKVDISDERTRDLVKQDYVSHRFLQWANEVLARTEIE